LRIALFFPKKTAMVMLCAGATDNFRVLVKNGDGDALEALAAYHCQRHNPQRERSVSVNTQLSDTIDARLNNG
jgi:hypothetical protein